MSFRDQREHLFHKNQELERQLTEEREKNSLQANEARQSRLRKVYSGVSFFLRSLIIVAVFPLGGIGWIYAVAHIRAVENSRKLERIEAHQHTLETLRQTPPEGASLADWLWCVDHCARYGLHGDSRYSEGMISDTFLDYRRTPPTELLTIRGPWLDAASSTIRSHTVNMEELDPPAAHFHVGDLVRVTVTNDGHNVSYTFRLIHAGE